MRNVLEESCGPWYVLIRAHDHVWKDRAAWPFEIRKEACQTLWEATIAVVVEEAKKSYA
jgi:hypothetical protein